MPRSGRLRRNQTSDNADDAEKHEKAYYEEVEKLIS